MFHELFGTLEPATYRAIRHFKVTPCEYDELVGVYGADEDAIRNAIAEFSPEGWYSSYHMMCDLMS